MSADYRLLNPYNKKFKMSCYYCGKDITNYNNVIEGHEQCVENQNSSNDHGKEDHIMRIDFDFMFNEGTGRQK